MYKSVKVRESFRISGIVYTIKYVDTTRDKLNQFGTCVMHIPGFMDKNGNWHEGRVKTEKHNIKTLERMRFAMRSICNN